MGEMDLASSPSKPTKSKIRSSSVGPLDGVKVRTARSDEKSAMGLATRSSRTKSKRVRSTSEGPLLKVRAKKSPPSPNSSQARLDGPIPQETFLELSGTTAPDRPRKTVNSDGKIRRTPKTKSLSDDSSDIDSKSKCSASSRSRRSSKDSVKGLSSRKSKDKSDVRKKISKSKSDGGLKGASRSDDTIVSSRRTKNSEPRPAGSERRTGRRSDPSVDRVSNETALEDSVTADMLDVSLGKKPTDLEDEIARLNKKIIEINEENLKVQFAAQAEAAKLRKEVREGKLELQRSQTQRRELRAELKERDLTIDESDRKIRALEKAVESQLDTVDDLEEELRRVNTDLFDMEEKLGDMERLLAESSAIETTVLQKEKDLGDKRSERMARRLEERESALEKRERTLRQDLEALRNNQQPEREIERLEQDNRMLLNALNMEREESAGKVLAALEEVKRLENELKSARVKSYSTIGGSSDEKLAKLLTENGELQRRLGQEMEEASLAIQQKDKVLALLQEQNCEHVGSSNGGGTGLTAEMEALKADLLVLQSKLEGSLRRNQLLEDDIDHWKSVNCRLEDDLTELKSQVGHWRSKCQELEGDVSSVASGPAFGGGLPYSTSTGSLHRAAPSLASKALGVREDDGDDDVDHMSTISEPTNKIANFWSILRSPQARKQTLDSDLVEEVVARTTFH
jgi:chromosome segregation ATPase